VTGEEDKAVFYILGDTSTFLVVVHFFIMILFIFLKDEIIMETRWGEFLFGLSSGTSARRLVV
jgi:hypothetical protein